MKEMLTMVGTNTPANLSGCQGRGLETARDERSRAHTRAEELKGYKRTTPTSLPLNRGLGHLGILNQLDNLGQAGIHTEMGDPDENHPRLIQGPAKDYKNKSQPGAPMNKTRSPHVLTHTAAVERTQPLPVRQKQRLRSTHLYRPRTFG